ncbi:hypothetical protein V8E54_013797 [Elaphomyces granulatus]
MAPAGQLQSPTHALPTQSSSPSDSRSSPASSRAAQRRNHHAPSRKAFQETIQHWRKAGYTIEMFLQAWGQASSRCPQETYPFAGNRGTTGTTGTTSTTSLDLGGLASELDSLVGQPFFYKFDGKSTTIQDINLPVIMEQLRTTTPNWLRLLEYLLRNHRSTWGSYSALAALDEKLAYVVTALEMITQHGAIISSNGRSKIKVAQITDQFLVQRPRIKGLLTLYIIQFSMHYENSPNTTKLKILSKPDDNDGGKAYHQSFICSGIQHCQYVHQDVLASCEAYDKVDPNRLNDLRQRAGRPHISLPVEERIKEHTERVDFLRIL